MKKLLAIICFCFAALTMLGQDANITAMEYYIDTDPGVGSGTSVTFATGPSVSFTIGIPTTSLSAGMHILVIRAQDQNGDWSIHESRAFYVSTASFATVANVTAIEYFFDTDPGFGNGNTISATAAAAIDIFQSIDVSSLSLGFHVIHYRVRDNDGVWGITESRVVFVSASGVVAQANISALEYFFDTEPGYGNGTAIPVTSATSINIQSLIVTASLPKGFHTLHIRARDNDGVWGMSSARTFFIDALGLITAVEYYIDIDPGAGSGTQISIAPPQATIDMNVTIPTTSLSSGSHTLGMRIRRADNNWSDPLTSPFIICSSPTADFASNIVCSGTATTFTDNSTTLVGDTYQWDFDSNGIIDATTVGNTSFSYPASGNYTATLTINRSGCSDMATVNVQVENAPIAQAGPDQNTCVDNTTLAANAPVTGETGTWSLISGSASITNASDPLSTLTNISSASVTLNWTVNNTLSGCSVSDQVTVISNQAITAQPVNAVASLGQTTNIAVQNAATVNTGDILITSILTLPDKGTATVSSGGAILYTPDAGTVGGDTVRFQLCNQCGRCSAGNLFITIQNNAPVIIPDPVVITTGETVSMNLLSIVSDPNNNLDPSSLRITQQPTSGAQALVDASFNLIINYTSIVFTGTDQLTIEACDVEAACASNIISIEVNLPASVDPPIKVYNAVSPNNDSKHDYLEIENITAYPNNRVYIFNRWGDKVFELQGYDNASVVFTGTANKGGGSDLPAGTYFYTIALGNGKEDISGFLVLKK